MGVFGAGIEPGDAASLAKQKHPSLGGLSRGNLIMSELLDGLL